MKALAFTPFLLVALTALAAAPEAPGEKTGGDTTVYATGRNAFSFPAANLTDPERTRFAIGNSFFKRNWVEAPASTKARDGLGPHFIARSCGGCHVNDGRGAPPEAGEQPVGLLLRLSIPGVGAHGGVVPEPTYGDQFNNFAVQKVKSEGQVVIRHTDIPGQFADGTPYTLQLPRYSFRDLSYGDMSKDVLVSPRVAPQLIGVGLLEAIAEEEILGNARAQAAAPGPIKGVVNRVWDAPSASTRVGRYGWKANVASIAHQTAGAFNGDIGITSSVFPDEACTAAQADCRAAPHGAQSKAPEIDDKTLGDVVFYQATLAPPARRGAGDPQVQRGGRLFAEAQCATCHRPSYTTSSPPSPRGASSDLAAVVGQPSRMLGSSIRGAGGEGKLLDARSPALNRQQIHPYTDLLLHDLGEQLADHRPDGQANGRQWKTPALWGVGLIKDVNQHTRLLHDGRARGVLEAILWHGGEAEASRGQVLRMNAEDRQALVKFVESL